MLYIQTTLKLYFLKIFFAEAWKSLLDVVQKVKLIELYYSRSSRLQMFFKMKACNFIKKRRQYSCFLVNVAKLLRTPYFTEHLR